MKEYNKQFEYRGYQLNILVELGYTTQGLSDIHRIVSNCMGFNDYLKTTFSLSNELESNIEEDIERIRQYVDNKIDGPPLPDYEQRLIKLGFK